MKWLSLPHLLPHLANYTMAMYPTARKLSSNLKLNLSSHSNWFSLWLWHQDLKKIVRKNLLSDLLLRTENTWIPMYTTTKKNQTKETESNQFFVKLKKLNSTDFILDSNFLSFSSFMIFPWAQFSTQNVYSRIEYTYLSSV